MPHPSLLSVVNWFPTGSETFVSRKLAGLRDAGFDVSVAAALFFEPGASSSGLGLVPTAPLRYPRSSWHALGPAGSLRAAGTMVAAGLGHDRALPLRRRVLGAPFAGAGADIVHFEFSGIAVAYRDLLRSLRPARLAVSCRGSNELILPATDPRRVEQLAAVFAEVDHIHCVSDAMRRVVEGFGADPAKILVNRPAIPVAQYAPLAAQRQSTGGPFRLLSVGRLHWVKGYDDALRAVAALVAQGRSIEYRIVGDGEQHEKLSFLIDQLGLGDVVHLVGAQTHDEVRSLLSWADGFVLSSLSEGISNAVLEAMASGLAVVSTNCGGMGEVIDPGVDGILVEAGEPAALAAALDRLVDDAELRLRLGRAAAARAADEFTLERQIRTFAAAYDALGAQEPRPRGTSGPR